MISLSERKRILTWVEQASAAGARRRQACELLGLTVRTLQRWRGADMPACDGRTTRTYTPENKLSDAEREHVLATANTEEFADLPPSQIVPRLAERGQYVASESTFYRVLHEAGQDARRQPTRSPAPRHKPDALKATAPNQVYSWDITYLPTSIKGMFFYLYVFMDVFSRKIVGWQVYEQELSDYASMIVRDIAEREGIHPHQVTLHSDNGGPMKGATMLATLQSLGIVPSFSRPSVSHDNPYSESLFKTLKYRPTALPRRFSDIQQAREWVAALVHWYNHEHRHSAIRFVTPAQRHAGLDTAILAQRQAVYDVARANHPERWSRQTRNWEPIREVYLNPEKTPDERRPSDQKRAA